MIGRQRGTRTSPVESYLTFFSTPSTFVLEALLSGRLLGIPMGTNSAPKLAESLPSYLRVRFHGQNNETGYYKSHLVHYYYPLWRRRRLQVGQSLENQEG